MATTSDGITVEPRYNELQFYEIFPQLKVGRVGDTSWEKARKTTTRTKEHRTARLHTDESRQQ